METILVTQQYFKVSYSNPLSAYLALSKALGIDACYLLESSSGPEADTRSSIVGFDLLLRISIKNHTAYLSGERSVADSVKKSLISSGFYESDITDSYALGEDEDLWGFLRAIQATFQITPDPAPATLSFGFFGYFGYDTVRYLEKLPLSILNQHQEPDICLGIYRHMLKFDHTTNSGELILSNSTGWTQAEKSWATDILARACQTGESETLDAPLPQSLSDSISKSVYASLVETALEHINAGDIYQIQLGHELTIKSDISPIQVYLRMKARTPAPYMFLATFGETTVLGASPEVFLRREGEVISMRPLAGTISCGNDLQEISEKSQILRSDSKEIAEHVMLVDLCRNDIGRICEPSTLKVQGLLRAEKYSRVLHLVSDVSGTLAAPYDAYDALAATFPAGTMTGAPKIRAMEIIEHLETSRRGLYAGALGFIDFNGTVNTALCIRSSVYRNGTYKIRASAGIVADSKPDQEWQETLTKMSSMYWAVTGEEITDARTVD